MDVSVIIVSWKVKDLLRKCLASIYRETKGVSFEVFVIDNASADGTAEMVLKEFPQVQFIGSNVNLGFAKANNEGIRQAVGDFVLLLNPDTELVGDAVSKLAAFARRVPQAAIAGPKLLNADGSLQPSVRRFPDLKSQVMLMLKLQALWPKAAAFRRRQAVDFDYAQEQPCDQVMGAAFLIRRPALEALGGLDESYFIWFEEVDYCKMAAEAGFQTWYTPSAEIIHHGGESFSQVLGPVKQRMFDESARRYFLKHHGRPSWLVLAVLRPASALLAAAAVFGKRAGMKGIKV